METKKFMTSALLVFGLLTTPFQLLGQEPKIEPPKLLAVMLHADWCATCKTLEPKIAKVKQDFQGQPILFTQFDLTDDFTKDQAARYAALLGLEDLYRENANKTGFMFLIEWPSKRVLGKITKEKTPEQIKSMLTHAQMGHPVGN